AEVTQLDCVEGMVAVEVPGRPGDQDLASGRDGGDACRPVDPETHVAVARLLRIAGVDADADADRAILGPRLGRERALRCDGRRDGLPGLLEEHEERVALRPEFAATVRRPGRTCDLAMPSQQLRVPVA